MPRLEPVPFAAGNDNAQGVILFHPAAGADRHATIGPHTDLAQSALPRPGSVSATPEAGVSRDAPASGAGERQAAPWADLAVGYMLGCAMSMVGTFMTVGPGHDAAILLGALTGLAAMLCGLAVAFGAEALCRKAGR